MGGGGGNQTLEGKGNIECSLCARHSARCHFHSTDEGNKEVKKLSSRSHTGAGSLPHVCPPSHPSSWRAAFCGCIIFLSGSANGALWQETSRRGETGQNIRSSCSSLWGHHASSCYIPRSWLQGPAWPWNEHTVAVSGACRPQQVTVSYCCSSGAPHVLLVLFPTSIFPFISPQPRTVSGPVSCWNPSQD